MDPRRRGRLVPPRASPPHAGVQRLVRDLNRLYAAASGTASARLRSRRLSLDHRRRPRRTRVFAFLRLGADGVAAGPRGLQHDAGAAPRLPHRRAARRARGARSSTATPALYGGSNLGNGGRRARRPERHAWRAAFARPHLPPLATVLSAARRLDVMASFATAPDAGLALSARRDLGRTRHQFRGLLRPRRAHRSVPVRSVRPARDRAAAAAGMHRRGLARLSARRPARACSTAIAPTGPTIRRTAIALIQQAAARSVCAPARRRSALVRCAVRLPRELAARRSVVRSPRQRAGMPKAVVTDESFNWGDDRPPGGPVGRYRHLRGASARPDHAARGHAAERARHLRRARPIRTSSTICGASASPRSSCCRSTPSCRTAICCRKGLRNYWGYNTHRLFRARAALSRERRLQRDARRDPAPACGRHRGHSRRRLQPHRRRQRARSDAVVPRPRQCELLPPGPGQSPPLRQRHRHRQHAQSLASARVADGDGFAALLGHVVPCRRLPLRSRRDARARAARLRSRRRASSTRCGRTRSCRASS